MKQKEIEFWEEYAKIYFNLEKARAYRRLANTIEEFIEPNEGDIWLDVGCGPAKMSELIWNKSEKRVEKIVAMDIVLSPAQKRLATLKPSLPVQLMKVDISVPLPFKDNSFDGIVANLVLSYVAKFNGSQGKDAFVAVLKEMFRVLKPGGHLVWSTPKENVHFEWVFLSSIPEMLNIWEYIYHKDCGRILQGVRVLKHALEIQKKGKQGIYTFLPVEELNKILQDIGFVNPIWKLTFARQVWVNKTYKPC